MKNDQRNDMQGGVRLKHMCLISKKSEHFINEIIRRSEPLFRHFRNRQNHHKTIKNPKPSKWFKKRLWHPKKGEVVPGEMLKNFKRFSVKKGPKIIPSMQSTVAKAS